MSYTCFWEATAAKSVPYLQQMYDMCHPFNPPLYVSSPLLLCIPSQLVGLVSASHTTCASLFPCQNLAHRRGQAGQCQCCLSTARPPRQRSSRSVCRSLNHSQTLTSPAITCSVHVHFHACTLHSNTVYMYMCICVCVMVSVHVY